MMRKVAIILLLLMNSAAFAQSYPDRDEEVMQKMMQQVQKMEKCMQSIEQEKLKLLEQRSEQFETEMKSLCASGKRNKAQEKAILFGKEMEKDPTMKTMQKCSEIMKGEMPNMPYMDQHKEYSAQHVCDQIGGN